MIDLKNTNIILTGSTGAIGGSILEKLNSVSANIIATGTNQNKLDSIKEKYSNIIINLTYYINYEYIPINSTI